MSIRSLILRLQREIERTLEKKNWRWSIEDHKFSYLVMKNEKK